MISYARRAVAAVFTLVLACPVLAQVAVPAPGASPRVDAIKKAGVLRVGVLANAPWLVENTDSQDGRVVVTGYLRPSVVSRKRTIA